MPLSRKRKPLLWILIDIVGSVLLLAGILKLTDIKVPLISEFFKNFPASLLISFGIGISVFSVLLFIASTRRQQDSTDTINSDSSADKPIKPTVERTKR